MPTASMDVYHLLEGILDRGLPFAASYLEKGIKYPITITDSLGKVHYPEIEGDIEQINEVFVEFPENIGEGAHEYYNGSLYYHIGRGSASAYIIIKDLPQEKVAETIEFIKQKAGLAIKYYFANNDKLRKKADNFEKSLAEYLFFTSHANIKEIVKLSGKSLDIDKPYYVKLAQIDRDADLDSIRSFTNEILVRKGLESLTVKWEEGLVFIIPVHFKPNTLEVDPEWPRLIDSIEWKEVIDQKYNVNLSIGLGKGYTLPDLHKSYREARIALTFPKLLGKRGHVQRFADLGIFSIIFSQDVEVLKQYCNDTLGKLFDYDKKNDGELIPTLRKLIDNNFNRKSSANSLFVHINTLHYRVSKIEQILGLEVAQMENRVDLFTAVKVYDTLRENGYID